MVMCEHGDSPALRNRVRSLLHVMFNIAVRQRLFNGAFTYNPINAVERCKEVRKKIEYWSRNHMNQFLEANREEHYYPLLMLLLKTGVRIGEALGIHAEQIDTTIDLLTIDRQFAEKANAITQTKGHKIRHIGLVPEVTEVLYPTLTEGLIFKKPNGEILTPNYFRQYILPAACERAKVKTIKPHGIRHTFSAHYLMDGGKLVDLKEILGHSSQSITESYYAHFDLSHVRHRMNVVSQRDNVTKVNFISRGAERGA